MGSVGRVVSGIALCAVLAAAGCGGSSESGDSGAAKVSSFDVSDVSCTVAVTAPVIVTWATANATAVKIAVDEMSPEGFGPSGTTTLLVPCDDESHEIAITPQSDAGSGETETKSISPD
ncbi:MAG TPA: hypothetical protein VFT35_13875 [Gaiellaceae bacterium]|jgi:hypothetical protein|nr:hypothetical protein [Gaiellaceae bacterium]